MTRLGDKHLIVNILLSHAFVLEFVTRVIPRLLSKGQINGNIKEIAEWAILYNKA